MTGSNNIHSNGSSDSSGRGNDVTKMMTFEANKKSTGLAYVIWFFLGGLEIHRFYLGRTVSGAAMLTLCVLGWLTLFIYVGVFMLIALCIWWIVDAFLISSMTTEHNNNLVTRLSGGPKL